VESGKDDHPQDQGDKRDGQPSGILHAKKSLSLK
jgi:hypothetical protein